MAVHLVRAASLTGYLELAGLLRLDPYPLLQAAGLPRACLHDPDLKIAADAGRKLLEDSAARTQEESFGLRLAGASPAVESRPAGSDRARRSYRQESARGAGQIHSLAQRGAAILGSTWRTASLRSDRNSGLRHPAPARQAIELCVGVLGRTLAHLSRRLMEAPCGLLHARRAPRSLGSQESLRRARGVRTRLQRHRVQRGRSRPATSAFGSADGALRPPVSRCAAAQWPGQHERSGA